MQYQGVELLTGRMVARSVYVAAPGAVYGKAFVMLGGDKRDWFEVPAQLVHIDIDIESKTKQKQKLPTEVGSVVKIIKWGSERPDNWVALKTAGGWRISCDQTAVHDDDYFARWAQEFEVIYEP